MNKIDLPLAPACIIIPRIFKDERGFFFESFRSESALQLGIKDAFVQDNHSHSSGNVIRGMHFQKGHKQAKLVRVSRGRVLDVIVDVRPSSPTLGFWNSVILSDENCYCLYVPPGFAHGFCTLSDQVDFLYKTSSYYDPELEQSIRFDDPDLAIPWPVSTPLISQRDESSISFEEYLATEADIA